MTCGRESRSAFASKISVVSGRAVPGIKLRWRSPPLDKPRARTLAAGPKTAYSPWGILMATFDQEDLELEGGETKGAPNLLAIGVTFGGLLLDVVAPRPKPRAGFTPEPSLLSERAVPRTPRHDSAIEAYDGLPVASGYRS